MKIVYALSAVIAFLYASNKVSYRYLKNKIVERQVWDLNICCGKTDGGGVNADIFKHDSVPNFVLTENIYKLPFEDKQFKTVLCSHTIEHVEDPKEFFRELNRVGEKVVLIIPPLWDISAVLNFLEHKWIFLTFKKEHTTLPPHVKLPFTNTLHKHFNQKISS